MTGAGYPHFSFCVQCLTEYPKPYYPILLDTQDISYHNYFNFNQKDRSIKSLVTRQNYVVDGWFFGHFLWQVEGTVRIHSNSCTPTLHGTNLQDSGSIPIWLPYTSHVVYHTTPVWCMVIPIQLPYIVLTCGQSNSSTDTIHSTNM